LAQSFPRCLHHICPAFFLTCLEENFCKSFLRFSLWLSDDASPWYSLCKILAMDLVWTTSWLQTIFVNTTVRCSLP
jgi:hypothetical protein